MIASPLLGALLLAAPAPLRDPPASPLLPASHWAVQAAWRLEALGLLEAWLPAQREVPLVAVEEALAEGARRAAAEAPEIAELAQGFHRRLLEEWRVPAPEAAAPELLGGSLSARLDARGRTGEPRRAGLRRRDRRRHGQPGVVAFRGRGAAGTRGAARDFVALDAVGPRRVAEFIHGAPDDATQADVVGFATRLIAACDRRGG